MEFKLKTKKLVDLDKKIFQANKFYSLTDTSLGNFPNFYAIKEFNKIADSLMKKLKEIKTEDEFEKIFVENSIYNLEAQKEYLEYFSKGESKVEKLFGVVLGKESLEILKRNIKNFDYEKFWEFYLSYENYAHKRIPSDDESLRQEMKEILIELKKDFLQYSQKNYAFPKKYDFELVLGQPYSDRTSFHPTNKRMEISPGIFFVYKEEGKININISAVIQSMFHEIIGHARHEIFSRDLPLSMQDNSINTSIPCLHVHFEGVSQLAEKDSIKFMQKYKEKYKIKDDYINQIILGENSKEIVNFHAYYKYLGLKKIEDNSFEQDEEFKKITKNYGLSVLFSSANMSPLSAIADAVYPVGLNYLSKIFEDIKKEIGEEAYNKNFTKINKSIVTGVFNFNVLPKFIKYYLKQEGIVLN